MKPIYTLLMNYCIQLYMLLLDLDKGNIYQGAHTFYYTDQETGRRKFIGVYIEGRNLHMTDTPLGAGDLDPELEPNPDVG